MSKLLRRLKDKGLISPPRFLQDGTQYLCIMGSAAYGCSNIDSDLDIYGYCIPHKSVLFPHTAGYIEGLDKNIPKFDQWQQHHIIDKEADKEYDFSVYNILKYFRLVMRNNPNMIDSLFVPRRCIIHTGRTHEHLRENRKLFLHKGAWHSFKGYAYSSMHKMKNKELQGLKEIKEFEKKHNLPNITRLEQINSSLDLSLMELKEYKELFKKCSNRAIDKKVNLMDNKFAYHVVRLLLECEQILIEGDLDLQRNREQLKSIRRGEWTEDQIIKYFEKKELSLEKNYAESKLPHSPDVDKIKQIYLECLEIHFGSVADAIEKKKDVNILINDIEDILGRYK